MILQNFKQTVNAKMVLHVIFALALLFNGLFSVDCVMVKDFIITNTLYDGEIETRIHFRGVTAKETSLTPGKEVSLRQLTNGKHFIQLIYEKDVLKGCEYLKKRRMSLNFLDEFKNDVQNLLKQNITVTSLDSDSLKKSNYTLLPNWLNYPKLRRKCQSIHRSLQETLRNKQKNMPNNEKSFIGGMMTPLKDAFIAPGTYWCGLSDKATKYTDIGTEYTLDRCCRRHDHCKYIIPGLTQRWGFWNISPFTMSHCGCDSSASRVARRHRRDLSELLRIPGTEWCGKGRSAKRYTHLGGFHAADKCCRTHDTACPFWIGAMEHKYGLFNWRVNTIMHCACDERFRTCLKLSNSSAANMVGKLFFNVVQTQCFVLKSKRVCRKHSWWGNTCKKHGYKKIAYLRDNVPY